MFISMFISNKMIIPHYYKTWSKVSLGLKLLLSLLFAKKVTVTASVLNQDHRVSNNRPTKRGKEKFPSDGQCQC
jgi:hypothetical protein